MNYLGMEYPKREGAPVHPSEIDYACDCWECQWKRERQLREFADAHGFDPPGDFR
jgi:hypothetical protein